VSKNYKRLVKDRYVHLIEGNEFDDQPTTLCGKKMAGLRECVVLSVEAASCPRCMVQEQRTHGKVRKEQFDRW
jgi:hypothetical protein